MAQKAEDGSCQSVGDVDVTAEEKGGQSGRVGRQINQFHIAGGGADVHARRFGQGQQEKSACARPVETVIDANDQGADTYNQHTVGSRKGFVICRLLFV